MTNSYTYLSQIVFLRSMCFVEHYSHSSVDRLCQECVLRCVCSKVGFRILSESNDREPWPCLNILSQWTVHPHPFVAWTDHLIQVHSWIIRLSAEIILVLGKQYLRGNCECIKCWHVAHS